MCIDDYKNGRFVVSGTVRAGRADLFQFDPAGRDSYHIGTLVGSSRSNLDRFERDCHRIVDALAAQEQYTPREEEPDMTSQLKKRAYDQGYLKGQRGLPINDADWEPEFVPDYRRGYADDKAGN